MSNMSYCRFRNTLTDLEDCYENMENPIDNEEESETRLQLVELCKEISDNYYARDDY